jgi:hypothetical protein
MAGPGIPQGEMTAARVGLHELGPKLLELAGAEPIGAVDFRSFAPVFRDAERAIEYIVGYAEDFGNRYWLTQRVLWEDE